MNFKENESAQKLRGGYYTPPDLARYLCSWLAQTNPTKVLEPSCGDGAFISAIAEIIGTETDVTAIELNPLEAARACERGNTVGLDTADFLCADFLKWYLSIGEGAVQYDAVVGNPPFIRYQYLEKQDQLYSEEIFRKNKLHFTKHTNAWVPFVIASINLLKPGGRLGMVLPAEILHVLHAQSLRTYLGQQCNRMIIVDPEEIWFEDTLQGAVLLMAEKKLRPEEHSEGLGIIRTEGNTFLSEPPDELINCANFINGETVEAKWTKALLSREELEVYRTIRSFPNVFKFDDIAEVDVGIVTGANKFFLVSDQTVENNRLQEWSHPMFGRSEHCPGILYDEKQHKLNSARGLPANFLWFNVDNVSQLSKEAAAYILEGESQKLHTRYKCRIRKPWFKVPSVYSTSVGMLKRSHDMPRLILNEAGAFTTDTAYRIRSKVITPKTLVYSFVNSFTALCAELEGRHYGGGVLELVPSEIEKLHIPIPKKTQPAIRSLDKFLRKNSADRVLQDQDSRVLGDLGLSKNEIGTINSAWQKLRARRQRRNVTVIQ